MENSKQLKKIDTSTEEKIIEAASKVFTQKGYAATRTRDIAEEAGINLALLNYYFRSKEKLFHIIMDVKLKQLFSVIFPIMNNEQLTLEMKIEMLAQNYINLLVENPDLPLFVLSEIKANPEGFKDKLNLKKLLKNSSFILQLKDNRPDLDPLHFLSTILGMTIFPFIAKNVLFSSDTDFKAFMKDRTMLITTWSKKILEK